MKRVISLLVAVILLFSFTACSTDTSDTTKPSGVIPDGLTPPSPSTNGANPTEPSQEPADGTEPNETEPSGEWIIKDDLSAPAATEPSKKTVTVSCAGKAYDVGLYQAHWYDVDPEVMLQSLREMPFFEGWEWSIKHEEKAYAEFYANNGYEQQIRYEYYTTLIATQKDDIVENKVTVMFSGDTASFDGWKAITVNYSVPGDEMDAAKQEAFVPVLEAVYGKEYAEYMAYAPETESRYGEMTLYIENGIGKTMLCRRLDDYSVYFTTYAYSNIENEFEYYAGEYEPILQGAEPKYFSDIYGAFGKMDFTNIRNLGSQFLAVHLNGYEYTKPDKNNRLYTYSTEESEDGEKSISFDLYAQTQQKDQSWLEAMEFELGYSVEIKDNKITKLNASAKIPAANEPEVSYDHEDATTLKYLQDYLKHAKVVANAVFGTDFAMEEVHWNGSSNYKLWATERVNLLGAERTVRFDFTTKAVNSIGKYRSSFTLSVG